MLLGAQRVGERIDAVELAQEAFELGAVAQRHDRAQVASVSGDRHAVDHQDVVVGDHDGIWPGERSGEQIAQASMRYDFVDGSSDRVAIERDQAPRLVVDERHAAVPIERDDALADAVQHRFAFLHERGDLVELEAERAPLQPSGQRDRGDHADRERTGEVQQQRRELVQQLV